MIRKNITSINIMGKRKAEHLDISLNQDVDYKTVTTGFEDYEFIHQALPEMDLESIDCSTELFGRLLQAPLLISSMVGGVEDAGRINRNLAIAAQELGVAMGVGSQRCAIEDSDVASTFMVRAEAPDILLLANVGAVQLNYGYGAAECMNAVDMIEADALILHLNPLQEALQREGNTRFGGLLKKIELLCKELPVPVIVKEVSFGMSEETARRLADVGVSGIDVAGAGGTAWSEVEKFRAGSDARYNVAASFASWGIPTAASIVMARRGAPGLPIIASGGIRSGLDAAKALALGSSAAGVALPLLKAAYRSPEMAISALEELIEGIRIAMFCIGAGTISELQNTPQLKWKDREEYRSKRTPVVVPLAQAVQENDAEDDNDRLSRVHPSQRVLLMSHCLRMSDTCQARMRRWGLECVDCNPRCQVNRLRKKAVDLGYQGVCVAPGGSLAVHFVKEQKPRGIIAVACSKELDEGIENVKKLAVESGQIFPPVVIVPLTREGCVNTEVNIEEAYAKLSLGCHADEYAG